jgi:anti-sigma regulatory factor (Ser/Thr protein kinase)
MGDTAEQLIELDLPGGADAPAAVRAALATQDQLGWIMGDAMLVASELVTNAVLHSGCSEAHVLHVTATVRDGRVRICVEDPGAADGSVSPLHISEFSDGGVGLLIVDRLVERWGAERDGGYRVWAELALPSADPG